MALISRDNEGKLQFKIFGTQVSGRAVREAQLHNVIEIVTMIGWLALVLRGHEVLGAVVLAVGLTVEHILALAAGKDA